MVCVCVCVRFLFFWIKTLSFFLERHVGSWFFYSSLKEYPSTSLRSTLIIQTCYITQPFIILLNNYAELLLLILQTCRIPIVLVNLQCFALFKHFLDVLYHYTPRMGIFMLVLGSLGIFKIWFHFSYFLNKLLYKHFFKKLLVFIFLKIMIAFVAYVPFLRA